MQVKEPIPADQNLYPRGGQEDTAPMTANPDILEGIPSIPAAAPKPKPKKGNQSRDVAYNVIYLFFKTAVSEDKMSNTLDTCPEAKGFICDRSTHYTSMCLVDHRSYMLL